MKLANSRMYGFLFILSALILVTAVLKRPRIESSADAASQREGSRVELQGDSLDAIVRGDFFAGMMGNKARLDRGMKYCENLLAENPRNAEALAWHGGGLLVRAAHAYT